MSLLPKNIKNLSFTKKKHIAIVCTKIAFYEKKYNYFLKESG